MDGTWSTCTMVAILAILASRSTRLGSRETTHFTSACLVWQLKPPKPPKPLPTLAAVVVWACPPPRQSPYGRQEQNYKCLLVSDFCVRVRLSVGVAQAHGRHRAKPRVREVTVAVSVASRT
eukprot:312218-Prymnesium_polylepis.1